MKTAVLYDIHGNLPALEAVLVDCAKDHVDQIIAGGDVILGPMSAQVLERLLGLEIPVRFIYGNCEVAILKFLPGEPLQAVPTQVLPAIEWTAKQLGSHQIEMLSCWQKTIEVGFDNIGKVLFCHAVPTDENYHFTKLSAEHELLPYFSHVQADAVICGHTHMQFKRMIGNMPVINAGSVGMPFGKTGAHWLAIDNTIAFRSTVYDLEEAAKLISKTGFPGAAEFARHVQNPPDEEAMLKLFTR